MQAYTVWCVNNHTKQLNGRALAGNLDARRLFLDPTRKFRLGLDLNEQS